MDAQKLLNNMLVLLENNIIDEAVKANQENSPSKSIFENEERITMRYADRHLGLSLACGGRYCISLSTASAIESATL